MSKVLPNAKAMSKNKRQTINNNKFRSAREPVKFEPSIDHLNYQKARRSNGPIYKVLSQELYEEGCTMAGDFFNCLVLKERKLFSAAVTLMHVKDDPELLFKLHENVKLAEKAAKLKHCGGMVACLKILHQTLKLLEAQSDELEWLLKDLYALFVDIAERYAKKDPTCNEIKAQLYCSYAMFWAKKTDQFEKCAHFFNKSLELCRGANWPAIGHKESRHYASLHEFVAIQFARIMNNYATTLLHSNPDLGIDMVLKAIVAISEVDNPSDRNIQNQVLLCESLVLKIALLVEQKKYEEALVHTDIAENRVDTHMGEDFMRLKCELLLLKGLCFLHLEELTKALMNFKNSLLISQKCDLTLLRGRALIHIGELYAKSPTGKLKAIKAFEESKLVFNKLHDTSQKRRAVYGLARILADNIFPHIITILKASHQFCGLYTLRKWKYLHEAPWEVSHRVSIDLNAPSYSHISRVDLDEQNINLRPSDEIDLTMQLITEDSLTSDDWSGIESNSQSNPINMDCLLDEN